MADLVSVAVPMLIAIMHVFFIVLAIGMPLALWEFYRAGQWGLLTRWAVVTAFCIFMAGWGGWEARQRWKAHVGGEKPHHYVIAYIISGFLAPMLIPEPRRLAKRRLRHERGGRSRRKFS